MTRPSIPAAYRIHPEPRPKVNGAFVWGLASFCIFTVAAVATAILWWA